MHGDPLITCPPEYFVSVNTENQEVDDDDIAWEILREELNMIHKSKDNLEHRKGKAKEFSQNPVMNKQNKQ